jgi:hypothetical protein
MKKTSESEKIPCEFAMDCFTPDGTFCPKYPDPDDCKTYHLKMVAEGEESREDFEAWKKRKALKEPQKKV